MAVMKNLIPVLYFLVELGMLAALAYTGFHSSRAALVNFVLGIGFPLLAATLWGVFAAPRSVYRLDYPYRILFALSLFGLTTFCCTGLVIPALPLALAPLR